MIDGRNILGLTTETIASWPAGNYVGPPGRPSMQALEVILLTIALSMLFIRLYLRLSRRAGTPGLDDLFMLMAFPGMFVYFVCISLEVYQYQGTRDMWNVLPSNYSGIAMVMFINQICFFYTSCCIKLSVCFLYRRLVLQLPTRLYLYIIYATILINVLGAVAFALVTILTCSPIKAYWEAFKDSWNEPYICLQYSTFALNFFTGVFSFVTDVFIAFFPIAISQALNISRADKLALNFVFSLGLFASAAAGVKTYYIYRAGVDSNISRMLFNAGLAAACELHLGMIAANAPASRVFVRMYIFAPFKQYSRRRKYSRSSMLNDVGTLRSNTTSVGDAGKFIT